MIKQTTRAEWGTTLHVSKTELTTFNRCPKQYKFQYVVRAEKECTPAALSFGIAIHAAVGEFYRQITDGVKPPLDGILRKFRDQWDIESADPIIEYSDSQSRDSLRTLGEAMLTKFYEAVLPRRVIAVEAPFSVPLIDPDTGQPAGIDVVGIIDLIEEDDEGNYIISELKTKAQRMSDSDFEVLLDGAVYSYALEQLGRPSALVRFDVLTKTKSPALQQIYVMKDESDRRAFTRDAKEILKAIADENFPRRQSWACDGCQFAIACKKEVSR
jgi:putative RecB family exonuclease